MASPPYGYRYGLRSLQKFPIDKDSTDIEVGDFVDMAGFTAGYVGQASAGCLPLGVAVEKVAAGSADGDAWVVVDTSLDSVYEYPPDTGSVSQGLVGLSMDLGGAQSVNIDAGTDDTLVCVGVDTTANTVLVKISSQGAALRFTSVA